MNILQLMNLTDAERHDACNVIHFFGEGTHPAPDATSVDFFVPSYLGECIDRALDSGNLHDHAVKRLSELKQRVDAHQVQKDAEFAAYRASLKVGKQVTA